MSLRERVSAQKRDLLKTEDIMAGLDKGTFAIWLRENALPPFGAGKCARFVREALEAAGADTTGHPVDAKNWGATLLRAGFTEATDVPYVAELADVVVIQPTSRNPHGHIAGFDGTNWISDFVQREMWPGPAYREEQPSHIFYRFA
jgi:hypothetical protein